MCVHLCVSLTEKLDEMLSSPKEPVVVMRPRPADVDTRAATVKQRPISRRITQAEISVSLKHINIHHLKIKSLFGLRKYYQIICITFFKYCNY